MNKRGLGRGLDALIPGDEPSREDSVEIGVEEIDANRFQPRKEFNTDKLTELAESIRTYGILQPLLVRKSGERYELVAGERRWRAAKLAGLHSVPIVLRDYTDSEMTAIALVENLQRENLNPIEEAFAYRRLMDEFGYAQDDVARKVGKSRSLIANTVRLLNLPEKIREYVSRGTMSPGQARPLLVLPSPELQNEAAEKIINETLTARDAEDLSKKLMKRRSPSKTQKLTSPAIISETEERLTKVLGVKVRISMKKKLKRIEIDCHSNEELERVLKFIEKNEVLNSYKPLPILTI